MLKGIRQFFDSHIQSIAGGGQHHSPQRAVQLATAALLFEVARADFNIEAVERQAITDAVQKLFDITAQESAELIALAEGEVEGAACLYEFTSLVNDHFDYPQKLQVVENMWRVALVNLDKDKYEEYVIRKVCDLIYVSHSDFVRLREQGGCR